MESEAANGGVSEEMLALYEAQRRAHETVLNLQTQIEEEETAYLEETPHGNIVRGWDGFIDSKQPRKDANPKKIKPYTEAEHLFSDCCFYATLASEPSFDLVDLYDSAKDESSGRRKLTVTLSVGKAAGSNAANASNHSSSSSSSAHDSASLHNGSAGHSAYRSGKGSKLSSAQKANDRKTAAAHPTSGKGSNASSGGKGSGSYPHSAQQYGKAAKLKKRKRDKLEYTNTANGETTAASAAAKTHEAGQDARTGHSVASTVASPARAAASSAPQGSVDDFLDVF